MFTKSLLIGHLCTTRSQALSQQEDRGCGMCVVLADQDQQTVDRSIVDARAQAPADEGLTVGTNAYAHLLSQCVPCGMMAAYMQRYGRLLFSHVHVLYSLLPLLYCVATTVAISAISSQLPCEAFVLNFLRSSSTQAHSASRLYPSCHKHRHLVSFTSLSCSSTSCRLLAF